MSAFGYVKKKVNQFGRYNRRQERKGIKAGTVPKVVAGKPPFMMTTGAGSTTATALKSVGGLVGKKISPRLVGTGKKVISAVSKRIPEPVKEWAHETKSMIGDKIIGSKGASRSSIAENADIRRTMEKVGGKTGLKKYRAVMKETKPIRRMTTALKVGTNIGENIVNPGPNIYRGAALRRAYKKRTRKVR